MNEIKSHLSAQESTDMMKDLLKAITILFIVHLFYHIVDENVEFLDETNLKLALYVTLGIVAYHVVIKRLVSIF